MKLHIGCGRKYLPGYKHLDVINYEHVDFVCDASCLDIVESGSVSEIYACHVLEHVKPSDVLATLREWYRVMMFGAVIRISVPDFKAIVGAYLENGNLAALQGLLYGGRTYDYNYHHSVFDYDMLRGLLDRVGFRNISRYDWRGFLPCGYDDYSRAYLPHMDTENGRMMSLNVIAVKPA